MAMVLMETVEIERTPMDMVAMAIMVMFMEIMDLGTPTMVKITKMKLKIRDVATAEGVETLSHCPSALILVVFRSEEYFGHFIH